MNTRKKMVHIADWLGWQHESMSFGLRSIADAEKLWQYWQDNADTLPEFADENEGDEVEDITNVRISVLGYDPMEAV